MRGRDGDGAQPRYTFEVRLYDGSAISDEGAAPRVLGTLSYPE